MAPALSSPRGRSKAIHDRCAIHFPQLPGLFDATAMIIADAIAAWVLIGASAGMAVSVVFLFACGIVGLIARR